MLYSQSLESDKFQMFTLFLTNVLEGKDSYKSYVDTIFSETKDLANHEKTIYDIDRENYNIILYLSENLTVFFARLSDTYSNKEYKEVLSFLEEQKDSIASELWTYIA